MDIISPNASVEETHIDYLYNNMQDIIGWVRYTDTEVDFVAKS